MGNYIDEIANRIGLHCGMEMERAQDRDLLRRYAALCLDSGLATTNAQVHNAWSAWWLSNHVGNIAGDIRHACLVPYADLSPEKQDLDTRYRDAIRRVAQEIGGCSVGSGPSPDDIPQYTQEERAARWKAKALVNEKQAVEARHLAAEAKAEARQMRETLDAAKRAWGFADGTPDRVLAEHVSNVRRNINAHREAKASLENLLGEIRDILGVPDGCNIVNAAVAARTLLEEHGCHGHVQSASRRGAYAASVASPQTLNGIAGKDFDAAIIDEPKTLHNSTVSQARSNVSDLRVVGNGDMFRLLCKASSERERWMKSTKAMEIPGAGCVVQVTTQQGDQVAEAVTFVPDVRIVEDENGGRRLKHEPCVDVKVDTESWCPHDNDPARR